MGVYNELTVRRTLMNSFMLSSDVTSGFDPMYASSFDKKNVAYLGKGFSFCKFTGSRGNLDLMMLMQSTLASCERLWMMKM